ncbi:sulfurtransferase/chromate resistance protein [Devosia sp. 1635]|uniref:chromate resistance protein ChrB domain-containing protein n=1 Tax=Devosia sp. 1635 TaxID=2726066 RepID=UPI001565140D|nr:sulfurtransferase/chromate resistance protein [Devosia sp. 1635]
MSSTTTISVDKLSRLIGTPKSPRIIDVRTDAAFADDPRLIPSAIRRDADTITTWVESFRNGSAIVICRHGHDLSHGVAAWLRQEGIPAEVLEGGHAAWATAGKSMVPETVLPPRNPNGRTVWVTRTRPKIDRIACPWLIRRFVDPDAMFLFVTSSEVSAVAERFGGVPFDIEGVFWSHRGELCTFDVMIKELALTFEPLNRLATIVRAADTSRHELAPEAAGLVAASLGLSRMYTDDLEQLDAGMLLYDAFYRWARDASEETHNWPAGKSRS